MMQKVAIIHGPNLNHLGRREPSVYGNMSLSDLEGILIEAGSALGLSVQSFQSNAESEIIEYIYACYDANVAYIVINPAAFTHSSIAIRDALLAVEIPFIEVHISNIHKREAFRHKSFFSDIATGVITGLGLTGYELALIAVAEQLNTKAQQLS